MLKKVILAGIVVANALGYAQAGQDLKSQMQKKFPSTPITSATVVDGIPGLVELVVGKNRILYSSIDGSKIVIGHIYNPVTNEDITQTKINQLTKIDYSKLPIQDAITIKKGDGSRHFAVFSDVDCPYCKKLEQEAAKVDNYTMHVFMFPLSIHPNAKNLSQNIWCAEDKVKAFEAYMLEGKTPSQRDSTCDTSAIDRNLGLGQANGVSGTPALIGKSGVVVPGFMPAPKLHNWLNQHGK